MASSRREPLVRPAETRPAALKLPALVLVSCVTVLAAFLLAFAAASTASAEPPPSRVRIGDLLPDVELPVHGRDERLRLSHLRGQLVVVMFYAPWCKPCHELLPRLPKIVARLRPEGVRITVVALVVDGEPEAQIVRRLGPSVRWLVDRDGAARRAFAPGRFPTTYLADAAGRVRKINRGLGRGTERRLERWLRELMSSGAARPGGSRRTRPQPRPRRARSRRSLSGRPI